MSHTFKADDGTVFIFNSDLSLVEINVHEDRIESLEDIEEGLRRVEISGNALLEFITDFIRKERIARIESATVAEIIRG